jgi:hypothetical protein
MTDRCLKFQRLLKKFFIGPQPNNFMVLPLYDKLIHVHAANYTIMWYYCAVTGESKKIVFTSGATEKIPSGGATSDF